MTENRGTAGSGQPALPGQLLGSGPVSVGSLRCTLLETRDQRPVGIAHGSPLSSRGSCACLVRGDSLRLLNRLSGAGESFAHSNTRIRAIPANKPNRAARTAAPTLGFMIDLAVMDHCALRGTIRAIEPRIAFKEFAGDYWLASPLPLAVILAVMATEGVFPRLSRTVPSPAPVMIIDSDPV